MDKMQLCRIITVYDPSNNIIMPKLKRQKRFYNKISNEHNKTPIKPLSQDHIDMIGNKIEDIIDYKPI